MEKICDCNQVFCNFFFGYTRDQAIQLTLYQITHPDSLASTYSLVQSLLAGSTQLQQANHKFKTSDARTVTCQLTIWSLFSFSKDRLATSEGRDPYLRIILEPAPTATRLTGTPIAVAGSSSPRSITRIANTGRRLSAPLISNTNPSSPLLRVRRQSLGDSLLSSPTGNPMASPGNTLSSLYVHPLLDSPTLRLRQIRPTGDTSLSNNDNNDNNNNIMNPLTVNRSGSIPPLTPITPNSINTTETITTNNMDTTMTLADHYNSQSTRNLSDTEPMEER